MRRLIAKSRIGVIISQISRSQKTELSVLIFIALFVLAFRGSSAEGQASLLDHWVREYVEEKALVLNIPGRISGSQMADINSIFSGRGGQEGGDSPVPTLEASTIRDSALMAISVPDVGYIDQIASRRTGITEYTVQEGDLLSFISSDFGVSMNSIIWANSLKDADSISPGQVLRIPPVTGVIHSAKSGDTAASLAKKYSADVERIIAFNRLPKDGALAVGEDVVIPDGKVAEILIPRTVAKGTAAAVKVVQAAKQFSHLADLGDYFKAPTFGFNWGRIHGRNGVDIANSCGTAIYAAADGTVSIADAAGYNGGFGKYLKITHGNGTESLYAHASKLLVSAGQVVGKGDKIMLMGTTGRSTGCHLHFEIHGARNPLAKY